MQAGFKIQQPAPNATISNRAAARCGPLDLNPKINFAASCNCHSACSGSNCVTKVRIPKSAPVSAGKGFENAVQQPVEGHTRGLQ
jgi:hypothetical protein